MQDDDLAQVLSCMSWLADSPLFIDAQQIAAFYDAVLGPAFRTVQVQLSADKSKQAQQSFGTRLGASLRPLLPWVSVDASAEAQLATARASQEGQTVVLEAVHGAGRQLAELSLHYMLNQRRRWCLVRQGSSLPGAEAIGESPRMLGFIDVAPGSILLPQAAELDDGRVVTFFDRLVENLRHDASDEPEPYPDSTASDDGKVQRDRYWNWFTDRWNADRAVRAAEEGVGSGGRPRWMDYRMRLDSGQTLHLHLVGRGEHDTGIFAYQLVRRGWRYGLKIVGSLKSKPAMNVLAIYEK